jgi:iron complex transport system substrate-binding protein
VRRASFVIAAVLVAACERAPVRGEAPWRRRLELRAADAFPRAFTTARGERVVIAAPPRRIVSATGFSDAVLLAICPRERIAALHALSKDPKWSPVAEESRGFPRHTTGDPEQILACGPDLVILASFSREETRTLLARARRTCVTFERFDSLTDVEDNVRALGWLTGLDAPAEALVDGMRATLARLAGGRERRRAWRVLYWNELRTTAGTATTFDDLLAAVGARNTAAEHGVRGSSPISSEQALAWDPDALVVGAEPGKEDQARAQVLQDPALASLRSVRNGRILFVPNAELQATCHHVVRAAERIAQALDRWGNP